MTQLDFGNFHMMLSYLFTHELPKTLQVK